MDLPEKGVNKLKEHGTIVIKTVKYNLQKI
jgi:hypothetical protein